MTLHHSLRWDESRSTPGAVMRQPGEKNYLELMRDLAAMRRSRIAGVGGIELDRRIREHEEEVRRRDHHER